MDELTLMSLISSKICHDLISPIGALANGVEVLSEDDDPDMREHAMVLLQTSVEQASAKLQFARLAYGASGSLGQEIDLREAENALKLLYGKSKQQIIWNVPAEPFDRNVVKLLLNLVYIAVDCIPRGGEVSVSHSSKDEKTIFNIEISGDRAKFNDGAEMAFNKELNPEELDARSIQPFLTTWLAKQVGAKIDVEAKENQISIVVCFLS